MSKRRRSPWDVFDEFEEEMRQLFEGMDWEEMDEPLVYGFNIRIGPEGEPIIEKFGNVRETPEGPQVSDEREPLVDVIEKEAEVTVIVELPGVEKQNIHLKIEDDALHLKAAGEEAKYAREIHLPARVKKEAAKAHYKNGVLEVTLKKEKKSKPKESIKIE